MRQILMPRRVVRKERGVFEKVPGSDIWWIRFKVEGVEHREKVGRRGDAINLYKIRKADILRGVKMPGNMKATRPHNGRIFLSRYGQDLNDPRKWFELALEETNVRNFRWHDLRHTFICRLVMKDVNLRTAQELAGHKTISMTTRYAHLAPEHNLAAIERLDPIAA